MAQVTATIASKVGLHARPAATFVKAVAEKGDKGFSLWANLSSRRFP